MLHGAVLGAREHIRTHACSIATLCHGERSPCARTPTDARRIAGRRWQWSARRERRAWGNGRTGGGGGGDAGWGGADGGDAGMGDGEIQRVEATRRRERRRGESRVRDASAAPRTGAQRAAAHIRPPAHRRGRRPRRSRRPGKPEGARPLNAAAVGGRRALQRTL